MKKALQIGHDTTRYDVDHTPRQDKDFDWENNDFADDSPFDEFEDEFDEDEFDEAFGDDSYDDSIDGGIDDMY